MRIALAFFLVLHGIAHLPGLAVSWRLMKSPELPYSTRVLGLDVGDGGMRVMGLLWLLAAAGFWASAAAAGTGRPGWAPALLATAAASLLLCAVNLPAARIGLAVDAAILLLVPLALASGRV